MGKDNKKYYKEFNTVIKVGGLFKHFMYLSYYLLTRSVMPAEAGIHDKNTAKQSLFWMPLAEIVPWIPASAGMMCEFVNILLPKTWAK